MKSRRTEQTNTTTTPPTTTTSTTSGLSNSEAQSQMTTAGGGGLSILDQARADNPVTLDDYALRSTGQGEGSLDVAGANARDQAYTQMELDDWVQVFSDAQAAVASGAQVEGRRTEEEMLAAIKAGTAPRYLARVGPKENFTGYNTFGRPIQFIFATEPADLVGCTAIEAMIKVGWTAKDIKESAAGKAIAVSVVDTSKALPAKSGSGTAKMDTGDFEWADLKAKAVGDSDFKKDIFDRLNADAAVSARFPTQADLDAQISGIIDIAASLPVGQEPSAPTDKVVWKHLRDALADNYGANRLYSGMGATIDEQNNLGAREVMVNNNDTGFALTPDNHRLIDIGPTFSADDVDRALTPPPVTTTGGA